MRDYTAKENAQYEQDLRRIELAWNNFSERTLNSTAVTEPHPALAVTQACYAVLIDAGVAPDSPTLSGLMVFGTLMFRFGQFCSAVGLLEHKMQPCICGEITDDDLKNLLGHT